MRGSLVALAAAAALALGCQPPQWVVHVSTDAPVPSWGDRLVIDVLDDSGQLACDACRREFVVGSESFPLSFGVAPPGGRADAPVRIRGRFFRASAAGPDGFPPPSRMIDAIGILPSLPPNGTEGAVLGLWGFCYGKPADLAARTACTMTETGPDVVPEETLRGTYILDLLEPNTVNRFVDVRCPTVVPPDMACVGTAAFNVGNADSVGVDTDYPPQPEVARRTIWPVLIDRDEMTVGAVRALIRNGDLTLGSDLSRRGDPNVPDSCTYLGPNDARNDKLPINCISRLGASLTCRARDLELPTEAQWELAAGNGVRQTRYPWGADAPTCDRTVVSVDGSCVRTGPIERGLDGDQNDLGIRNLGGNVSEWTADIFVPYTDECWNEALDLKFCASDPRIAGWGGPWPHRGGSWDRRATSASSFARFASLHGDPSPSIGFRCANTILE